MHTQGRACMKVRAYFRNIQLTYQLNYQLWRTCVTGTGLSSAAHLQIWPCLPWHADQPKFFRISAPIHLSGRRSIKIFCTLKNAAEKGWYNERVNPKRDLGQNRKRLMVSLCQGPNLSLLDLLESLYKTPWLESLLSAGTSKSPWCQKQDKLQTKELFKIYVSISTFKYVTQLPWLHNSIEQSKNLKMQQHQKNVYHGAGESSGSHCPEAMQRGPATPRSGPFGRPGKNDIPQKLLSISRDNVEY